MPQPTEIPTLAGALDDMSARGFTAQFTVTAGRLHAMGDAATFSPDEVAIAEDHRFEGVSDPDDMAIAYGLETRTGLRGTLVDAFGVYADPSVGEFMRAVALRHGGPGPDAGPTPANQRGSGTGQRPTRGRRARATPGTPRRAAGSRG